MANAWALPGGKIAINRGLLTELDSEAELAAVLGHEVVHAAARHTAQQMLDRINETPGGLVVMDHKSGSDRAYRNITADDPMEIIEKPENSRLTPTRVPIAHSPVSGHSRSSRKPRNTDTNISDTARMIRLTLKT